AKRPFSREQRTTIVYGMLVFVLIIVILQLWLLTATMNAWLGGDDSILWPAAAVSAGGLMLNVGLLTYLGRLERTRRTGESQDMASDERGFVEQSQSSRPFYGEYAWAFDLVIDRPVRKECAAITNWLIERGVLPGATLLDAGCGTGRYAGELAR